MEHRRESVRCPRFQTNTAPVASAIDSAMWSPSPVPPGFFDWSGESRFFTSSSVITGPLFPI